MIHSQKSSSPDWFAMDDQILIKAHLHGDAHAFEVLVKKYQNSVAKLCYSILRSHNGVADVSQNVFLAVYRGLEKYRGEASFKTWICKIAVRETFTYLKKEKKWNHLIDENKSLSEVEELQFITLEQQQSPESIVLNQQKKNLIETAISKLSKNHRLVLNLHYLQDLSVQEVAYILEIPEGSVKSRLYYSRIQLKKLLESIYEELTENEGVSNVL